MLVSVISATYNRAELLDNALYTYSKQDLPTDEWEYLICDDMSSDNTKEVVEKWIKKGLPLRYFTAEELGYPKQPGQWRDGCTLRNALSTFATGLVLVATHPEIMIPPNALTVMAEEATRLPDRAWVTAIPYWMPDGKLPSGWKSDLSKITTMKGFYDPSWPDAITTPGAPDYRNQNQESRTTWESEVFWAMKMSTWRWFGGFHNFTTWGSVDMDFLGRRRAAHIKTVIAKGSDVPSGNLMVFHQNHDSKRDMKAAVAALKESQYRDELSARKAGALYANYNTGPRERAQDGKIGGILADHIARYQFAANFTGGKHVIDIPCGTGYGAHVLFTSINGKPSTYEGFDIDEESIEFASGNYKFREAYFFSHDMQKEWPVHKAETDIVLSFEGFEHIEDKKAFVDEMWRVLKPGGTFIISTPQKGVASGTPWDKFMVDRQELMSFFQDGRWTNLDWFYQNSYGSPQKPIAGTPPTTAQVMILGGTKVV